MTNKPCFAAWLGFVVLLLVGCTSALPALAEEAVGQEGIGQELIVQEASAQNASVRDATEDRSSTVEVLTFDMAEDFTRFVFDPDIVHEEGYPVHGSPFITQGYLYPAGTLEGSDGVNPDGSPEFPDKVLGTWICRGWILGDTMGSDGTPSAISTQFFQLGEEYGNRTIITDGYEFMQPGHSFKRAITGGTDEYSHARGDQIQELLGINEYMGTAIRFELRLEK